MKIGSLFAGIGGFDLAARWMGWETVWYSEIEPYASAVMAKNFPGAINLGDVTRINGITAPPVDMLCGGFPCQDISIAGKGAGISGSRSKLWSHYVRLIGEIRPSYAVIENSPLLRSRGLDYVLGTLDAIGYDAEWHCIPASAIGARHRRDRIWIIAYPNGSGFRELGRRITDAPPYIGAERVCETLADANGRRCEQRYTQERIVSVLEPRSGEWRTESGICRVADGVPGRVGHLRCLGNALVPQVAHEIFKAIEADRFARDLMS